MLTSEILGRAAAMNLKDSLEILKATLVRLAATGDDGFEGLMAVILTVITGHPFRLASAGSQGGLDGRTHNGLIDIAYEAKLYTSALGAKVVHDKITVLLGSAQPPDLWILGATVPASTQVLAPMTVAAERAGLAILVLDWAKSGQIPPLAAACALAPTETADFLADRLQDPDLTNTLAAAIAVIRGHTAFPVAARAVTEEVSAPHIGLALAQVANRRTLEAIFESRRRAKGAFGQALAPRAKAATPLQSRATLMVSVAGELRLAADGDLTAVLGVEGAGKSWLVAQSWLEAAPAPLLLLVSASDLPSDLSSLDLGSFLVRQFIQQTDDHHTDLVRRRWEARLARWQKASATEPRFVLCVDGLNQNDRRDWGRWLDGAAETVERYGGRLMVTCRARFYNDHVRNRLMTETRDVRVPEWSDGERDSILRACALDPADLKADVRARLCNPRLLAVALELLDVGAIVTLAELSVERLLFEYARYCARDGISPAPIAEFAHALASHAEQILRHGPGAGGSKHLVFEGPTTDPLAAGLKAVMGEQFIQPLDGDPSRYVLSEDGLDVALGLALIRALQMPAEDAEVSERLRTLLEPVEALDKTAVAVGAAVSIAAADETLSGEIRRALIVTYLRLQNLSGDAYPAFLASVRAMPGPALDALAEIATAEYHAAHTDWLISAFRTLRHEARVWPALAQGLRRWLRTYSLSPALQVNARISEVARHTAELDAARERLDARVLGLSASERRLLDSLDRRDDIEPARLHLVAFRLLAGMPLAPFVDDLIASAFAGALNSGVVSAREALTEILLFNRIDWRETRTDLLEAAQARDLEGGSRTGHWAVLTLLDGLATPPDALRRKTLYDALTADRPVRQGWRLLDDYCATDPCDPEAEASPNVQVTAARYQEISFADLGNPEVLSHDDGLFQDALPAVARFHPEIAAETLRDFARAVLGRESRALFLGLAHLRGHAALLEPLVPDLLRTAAAQLGENADPGASRYEWISAQSALYLAFPHLTATEQADALAGLASHGPLLLDLLRVAKPLTPEGAGELIASAVVTGDHHRVLAALGLARLQPAPLTPDASLRVRSLLADDDSRVRSQALALAGQSRDPGLLAELVRLGWSAHACDDDEAVEAWHGSVALIEAARLGLIAPVDAVGRIEPELFGYAVSVLGEPVVAEVGARIAAAVGRALDAVTPFDPPRVEMSLTSSVRGPHSPPRRGLVHRRAKKGMAALREMVETEASRAKRQAAAWARYGEVRSALDAQDAQEMLRRPSPTAVAVCARDIPEWAEVVADLILQAPEDRRDRIANLGHTLAVTVAPQDPGLARRLFEAVADESPSLNLVHGSAKLSLERLGLWAAKDDGALDDLRTQRLDARPNDAELADEVLAALQGGRGDFLDAYAARQLAASEPVRVARGLTVLGFGAPSAWAREQISRRVGLGGLVSDAALAALAAYDRNVWARHWWERMQSATVKADHWQAGVLFMRIVDGRFDVWRNSVEASEIAADFSPLLSKGVGDRVKARRSKRERKLFGVRAPDPWVLG